MLGYIKGGRDDAQADRDVFATAIRGMVAAHRGKEEFEHAWSALTDEPPRKQVIRDGALAWKATEPDRHQSDEAWILRCAHSISIVCSRG